MKNTEWVNELRSTLRNKRRISHLFKETKLEVLIDIYDRLGAYVQERMEQEESKKKAMQEAENSIAAIVEKTGLSWEEVTLVVQKNAPTNKNRKAKTNPATSPNQ